MNAPECRLSGGNIAPNYVETLLRKLLCARWTNCNKTENPEDIIR